MSYNAEFYEKYRAYLEEPLVRLNHDRMFNLFTDDDRIPNTQYVLDLGCGTGEVWIRLRPPLLAKCVTTPRSYPRWISCPTCS